MTAEASRWSESVHGFPDASAAVKSMAKLISLEV
jgi:hypothetical protein